MPQGGLETMSKPTAASRLGIALLGMVAGGVAGCSSQSGKPFVAWGHSGSASSTAAASPRQAGSVSSANAGVVAHKPFIAAPQIIARELHPAAKPTILLALHARSDSPVPLQEYARQPVHSVSDFHLRPALSAAEVRYRLGPPAQLADYSTPWFVYRLHGGRELWLHFAQPFNDTLVAADVVGPVEDGYTRNRVFSIQDAEQ